MRSALVLFAFFAFLLAIPTSFAATQFCANVSAPSTGTVISLGVPCIMKEGSYFIVKSGDQERFKISLFDYQIASAFVFYANSGIMEVYDLQTRQSFKMPFKAGYFDFGGQTASKEFEYLKIDMVFGLEDTRGFLSLEWPNEDNHVLLLKAFTITILKQLPSTTPLTPTPTTTEVFAYIKGEIDTSENADTIAEIKQKIQSFPNALAVPNTEEGLEWQGFKITQYSGEGAEAVSRQIIIEDKEPSNKTITVSFTATLNFKKDGKELDCDSLVLNTASEARRNTVLRPPLSTTCSLDGKQVLKATIVGIDDFSFNEDYESPQFQVSGNASIYLLLEEITELQPKQLKFTNLIDSAGGKNVIADNKVSFENPGEFKLKLENIDTSKDLYLNAGGLTCDKIAKYVNEHPPTGDQPDDFWAPIWNQIESEYGKGWKDFKDDYWGEAAGTFVGATAVALVAGAAEGGTTIGGGLIKSVYSVGKAAVKSVWRIVTGTSTTGTTIPISAITSGTVSGAITSSPNDLPLPEELDTGQLYVLLPKDLKDKKTANWVIKKINGKIVTDFAKEKSSLKFEACQLKANASAKQFEVSASGSVTVNFKKISDCTGMLECFARVGWQFATGLFGKSGS